jgi:hypothetical protein
MISVINKIRIKTFPKYSLNLKFTLNSNAKFIKNFISKMEPLINKPTRLVTSEEEKVLSDLMEEMKIVDSNMPIVPAKNIKVTSFGGRIRVSALLASDADKWIGKLVTVGGWVKTLRVQGGGDFAFVELNDGSTIKGIQVVVHKELSNFAHVIKEGIGSCLQIRGLIVKSQGNKQPVNFIFIFLTKFLFFYRSN